MLFKDSDVATEILKSHDPREQKALGRNVRNFDDKVWNQHCKGIVKKGNLAKVCMEFVEVGTVELRTNPNPLVIVERAPH